MKEIDKVTSQIEEVVDEASGKVYLPPCQVRCPLSCRQSADRCRRTRVAASVKLDRSETCEGQCDRRCSEGASQSDEDVPRIVRAEKYGKPSVAISCGSASL